MGLMTLAEMRVDVRLQMGQRTNIDPATDAGKLRLDNWINRANRWMCNPAVFKHPAMKQSQTLILSEDLDNYPLPANLFAIRFVINETKNEEYDPEIPQRLLDGSGRERRFARDGNKLLFRATAQTDGDTVRVYYWARPKLLSDDAHKSEVEEYFDEALIQRASGAGCAALGELARASYFFGLAAAHINEMRDAEVFEASNERWENNLRERTPYQRWSR